MDLPRMTRSVHSLNHVSSFKDAVNSINRAVKNSLPSKKGYDCVRVLTLRWANDDLGLEDIESELLKFFFDKFHYATDSFLIPASSNREARLELKKKLWNLISKHDTPSTLFIVIYEGHSFLPTGSSTFTLCGSTHPAAPTLPWGNVESSLEDVCHGDVLIILDSCFSTAAATGAGDIEYLAASAQESVASGCVDRSFTRRFIDFLATLEHPEITVAQVHARLIKQSNTPDSGLDYTPVHIAHLDKPSITLRPLHKMPKEVATLRRTGELSDGKVLISVLLHGKSSIPRIEEWKRWLIAAIPEAVADVKIEAVFESMSSLCLVTMPVAVWDMLKANDAYEFIAYVESHNLLLSQPYPSNILEGRAGNVQLPTREK